MLSRRTRLFSLALAIALAGWACACNIPVFRYALERWPADPLQLLVFQTRPLKPSEQEVIETWRRRSNQEQGHANLRIKLVDPQGVLTPQEQQHWQIVQANRDDADALQAVLCGQHGRGQFQYWHGEVDDLQDALHGSPAITEIQRRLLAGHAVVWVVIRGTDAARADQTMEVLREAHQRLEQDLELPEGIGLPGSELFSDVPLFLRFSTLELDRSADNEVLLLSLVKALQPAAFDSGETLVLPVFGRGRVLEVVPASILTRRLVEDMTGFLCGACSCQVKEQNPGFDLMMDVDWDQGLFGEQGERPPASADGLGQVKNRAPVLLTIPPGREN